MEKKLKEGRETLPAVQVDNEVLWVNPNAVPEWTKRATGWENINQARSHG